MATLTERSWFFSVLPGRLGDSTRLGHDLSRPDPIQFGIHQSSFHSATLYVIWYRGITQTVNKLGCLQPVCYFIYHYIGQVNWNRHKYIALILSADVSFGSRMESGWDYNGLTSSPFCGARPRRFNSSETILYQLQIQGKHMMHTELHVANIWIYEGWWRKCMGGFMIFTVQRMV